MLRDKIIWQDIIERTCYSSIDAITSSVLAARICSDFHLEQCIYVTHCECDVLSYANRKGGKDLII